MKHRNNNPKKSLPSRLCRAALASCLALLSAHAAWAQEPQTISLDVPRIVPVSPEAAMMEKFQSYPVDHCTGVPEITIPLYEIDLGELTVPVTLSYHASGLKPKERSGLAGTGWTLNLEPSVMREIKGIPDEDQYGWFNRHDSWNRVPVDAEAKYEYYSRKFDNTYDTWPDKYIYRLPHSGSAGYFDDQFSPLRTAPRTNDRVIRDGANYIEITDAQGIRYYFGDLCETLDNHVTRWMCSNISSARTGDLLASFQYDSWFFRDAPVDHHNLHDQLIFVSRDDRREKVLMIDQNAYQYYELTPNSSNEDGEPRRQTISPEETETNYVPSPRYIPGEAVRARLREVRFFGNKLNVYYTTTGEIPNNSSVYDRIEVHDADGKLVRTIRFRITPYNNRTPLTKLDSVIISAPGAEDRAYSFEYHDANRVPSVYTSAVDHWGFCNGPEGSEQHTIPSIQHPVYLDMNGLGRYEWQTVHYEGVSREPDAGYTKAGVLPTGVRTTFDYEGNAAAFRDNAKDGSHRDYLHPVGGLRVRQVETYDPQSRRTIRKSYRYGLADLDRPAIDPVWGGGAVKHLVTQRDYYSDSQVVAHGERSSRWQEHAECYSSLPVSNITFGGGSAVMYNVVEETVRGHSGDFPQYTNRYFYQVRAHDFEDVLHWDDERPADSVRELLLNGITEENKQLVRPEPYRYPEPSPDFNSGATAQMDGLLLRVERYRGRELVQTEERSSRCPSARSSSPRTTTGTASTKETPGWNAPTWRISTRCHRSSRRPCAASSDTPEGRTRSSPARCTSTTMITTTRTPADGSTATDDYGYLQGHPAILSFHRHAEQGDTLERWTRFRAGTPLPERVQSRTDGAPWRDEVRYTAYGHGHPSEIRGKDGTPVAYLWSYNDRFPVAMVENASIQEVRDAQPGLSGLTFLDAPGEADWERLDGLRALLPHARVTVFRHDPLKGVVSVTDPNGRETRYDYDGYARLTQTSYLKGGLKEVLLGRQEYHWEIEK